MFGQTESYPPVRDTWFQVDLEGIRSDVAYMLEHYPITDWNMQRGLIFQSDTDQDPTSHGPTGSMFNRDMTRKFRESDFTHFFGEMQDGPLHRFYQELQASCPYRLARMRIALMRSRTCYGFHNDEEIRYHLAVETNPHCYLLMHRFGRGSDQQVIPVDEESSYMTPLFDVFRIPADGHVYEMNANHPHTAVNAGYTDRIHILISTVSEINERS